MALADFIAFENPFFITFIVGLLIFLVISQVIMRFMRDRGIAMVIAIVLAMLATWKIYSEGFYGLEIAVIIIGLAILVLLIKIAIPFVKRKI